MTETIDYLKTLRGNVAYPRNNTCKICGFNGVDGIESNFRFSNVCGSHDCRIKANICDCISCRKINAQKEYDKTIEKLVDEVMNK